MTIALAGLMGVPWKGRKMEMSKFRTEQLSKSHLSVCCVCVVCMCALCVESVVCSVCWVWLCVCVVFV